ncbi:MAG: adenosine deaminase family protein, partial [Acidimicrobiales bacterium]
GRPEIDSLPALLAYLDWSCRLIDRSEELEQIAYAISERARESGALHVDVITNPTHWPAWQPHLPSMIDALEAGFRAAEEDGLGTASLCISLKRSQSRSEALELVDLLIDLKSSRVSALSIDGNEAGGAESNNARFAPAFERARAGGLRLCAHAGESSGPEGVREAIEILGAERIDHGIRALEDEAVVSLVAERGVPLDICPSSNVFLGVVADLATHPIKALMAAGVACSLNTDDPVLYGIDLAGEYSRCAEAFAWGADELAEVAEVSLQSCFAREDRKKEMQVLLRGYLNN